MTDATKVRMKITTLVTTTALAALLAGGVAAQDQVTGESQQEPSGTTATSVSDTESAAGGSITLDENVILMTQMIGLQIYATPQGMQSNTGSDTMSSGDLTNYVSAGQITDVVVNRDSGIDGVIVALMRDDVSGSAGDGRAVVAEGADINAGSTELMISADRIRLVSDDTVPTLWWAIVDMPPEELQQQPTIDRMSQPIVGSAPTGSGMGGSGMGSMSGTGWGAPSIAMEGYQPVPVSEMTAENLIGAQVYGVENSSIGSVNDIVFAEDGGEMSHVIVNIGGFLGIGSREIAISFDEMTVVRDAGWSDLQVHVAATQEQLESAPEYQRAN